MVDTVNTTVLNDGPRNYIVLLQSVSDGTGEATVTKVNISTLRGPSGATAPTDFSLKNISWSIQGMNFVQLLFNANTNDLMITLSEGVGYDDLAGSHIGDPNTAGSNGDILLTTNGASNNGSYSIVLHLIKHT